VFPNTSSFRPGLALILFAAMTWGTTGLTSKVLNRLSAVDAVSVGALRLLVAFPALLLLAQTLAPGTLRLLLKREWRAVLLMGLSMAAYNGCFFAALARTSVTAGTLLAICSAPLFVAILARLFLDEPLTRPILLALATGLIGTALLRQTDSWVPIAWYILAAGAVSLVAALVMRESKGASLAAIDAADLQRLEARGR